MSGDRLRTSGLLVCVVCDVLSVPCSPVITCWESSDLLTLMCSAFFVFLSLYIDVIRSGVYKFSKLYYTKRQGVFQIIDKHAKLKIKLSIIKRGM